jgi:hypothetical protein
LVGSVLLKDLVVDEREFDQSELAGGLSQFLRLGSGGDLRPGDAWDRLSERAKVVAVLLAYKAGAALAIRTGDDGTAREISDASGVGYGTVRPTLRELLKEHLVHQPARGKYAVPSMRVRQALRVLTSGRSAHVN